MTHGKKTTTMKRLLYKPLLIVCLFLTVNIAKSSHNTGGYILHRLINNDSLEVTTIIYKDCKSVSFSTSIIVELNSIGGAYLMVLAIIPLYCL